MSAIAACHKKSVINKIYYEQKYVLHKICYNKNDAQNTSKKNYNVWYLCCKCVVCVAVRVPTGVIHAMHVTREEARHRDARDSDDDGRRRRQPRHQQRHLVEECGSEEVCVPCGDGPAWRLRRYGAAGRVVGEKFDGAGRTTTEGGTEQRSGACSRREV